MTKSLCTIGTVLLMVASGFAADTVKVEATTNGASVIPAVTNNSTINIPVSGTQTSASALTTNSSTPLPTPEPTATPSPSTTQSPASPSTTTHSPSSSSTTPSPVPKVGSWSVVGQNNATCVKFDGIIEIDVPYHNATEDLNLQTIYVPSTANATGQCGSNNQSISLSWLGNHVDIHFSKDESKREFELSSILANISAIHFPDLNKNFTGPAIFYSNFSKVLSTTLDMSYSCTSVKGLILNDVGSEERAIFNNASVSFSSLHYQAFISKNNNFGEAYRCEADAVTPDIVPIVVGCALALLVIVVLVAYLIGRRRSQSHGYLSM